LGRVINREQDEFSLEWYARGLPVAVGPAIVISWDSLAADRPVLPVDRGLGELSVRTRAIAATKAAAVIVATHTRGGRLVVFESRAMVSTSTSLVALRLACDA
jgi:hypothetical protein